MFIPSIYYYFDFDFLFIMGFLCIDFDFYLFFWPRPVAFEILAPQPGIEPMLPTVEVWSLNHGAASEVPIASILATY